MQKATAIIGGGFGDEGKGLFTDAVAARGDGSACVIRFNGGAQAGHTVQLADGRRHVFSHFGSGSYAGLPTFLSAFFVCHPILFLRERAELVQEGLTPQVFADPACPITTPYDMMINQIVEEARGQRRHGSVGVGFGETLERHAQPAFALTFQDLQDEKLTRAKLDLIRQAYVPRRLAALGLSFLPEPWARRLDNREIRDLFIEDCARFRGQVAPCSVQKTKNFDHLIFEGAQGLLLDQTYGWFPHVTRSHTGLKNILALARDIGLGELKVYYLTRCYATRHGAGPLPHELAEKPYEKIEDRTNVPNAYQGALRFAWFDLDLFRDTVARDLRTPAGGVRIQPRLGISCLDQIDGPAIYWSKGVQHTATPDALLHLAAAAIGADEAWGGFGPTRATLAKMPLRTSGVRIHNHALQPFGIMQNDFVAAVG